MSSDFGVWRKSSFSASPRQDCVEVRDTPHQVHIRDTQNRALGHLTLPSREWAALLGALRRDEVG
jgi:hypothetical protein